MNTIQLKKINVLILGVFWVFTCFLIYGKISSRFQKSLNDLSSEKQNVEINRRKEASDRPGDMGYAVHLTREEEEEAQKLWNLNEFNMVAAAKVPLDRTLPDFRHEKCKNVYYPQDTFPKASIIVIFHNEEWYTLLRTATSCFNRSPSNLLEEIILVDDFSDRDHLKEPLQNYLDTHFNGKVRLVRTPSRHGLIRAKNYGSRFATGPALIFLDSHCECTEGWLPPLLNALKKNPKTIVQPVIPGIDGKTLSFRNSEKSLNSQGTFEFSLLFYWRNIIPEDQKLRKSEIDHIRSPTLAGGLFGLMKDWWEYLGRYDDGMELWGGENLELSFKSWLCGGMVEYIPCSHVGHIYRGKHPYKWYKAGPDRAFTVNARRLAEVWLDEYKKFFYMIAPDAHTLDMGDISDRLELKKRLNCKPFKWFITDVVKDMYPPTTEILAEAGLSPESQPRSCLDTMGKKNGPAKVFGCHGQGGNQAAVFTGKGEISINIDACLETVSKDTGVYLTKCNGNPNQFWTHEGPNTPIVHQKTGQCLTFESDSLKLKDCSADELSQKWSFKKYL